MSSKPRFVGEKVKLGEVISKAKVERCGNRSFPVYSMTMHDGIVEQSGRFKKTIASRDTSSYKVVKKNQLVVGFPIDEGVIYVQNHDQPGIMSPAYSVWDFDSDRILPAYLEFALHSPQSMAYYAEKMRGTTARRRTLTGDALKNMSVPVPSIEDQYAVVKTLNCIRSQLAATHQMLDKLDHLVKSRFVEMFKGYVRGGNTVALSELCEFVTVGIANAATHAYADDGIVMLRNLNVRENYLDDSDLIKINPDFAAKYSKKTLKAGDILVTRTGYPGIACVVPEKYAGCQTFTTLIARLKSDAQIIPLFLSFWINSPVGKEFVERMKAGSSQQNFGATSLKLLEVPLPPLSLQQEFAAFVSQVDKSRFIAQQQIEKLQMLYDSLAQDYFGD